MFSPRLVENLKPVTHASTVSAEEDKINRVVAHSILAAFGTPSSPQVLNVLKATIFLTRLKQLLPSQEYVYNTRSQVL